MAHAETDISIDRSPDDVWKLVRDFGGIAEWMPGVETCEVDGDVRTIGMMGISIKEKLMNLDDATRSLSYSIVESPMGNLESHLVTIAVAAAGDGSHVTWTTDVAPDELMGLFAPTYEAAIGEIKKKAESS
jgi:carbon monoxide dehydrogenase subunit G